MITEIAALIRPRDPLSHKGTHGHALLIAGNKGKMGAAVLAARACLRTGAGLVTVAIPEEERFILQTAIPEAMLSWRTATFTEQEKYTTIGIGPGIGTGEGEYRLLTGILQHYGKPIVLDADALNLLSLHKEDLKYIPAGSILTPHPKEFDRLFGDHATHEERIRTAIRVSEKNPWVIILKNAATVIIQDGTCYTNTTGNAGLAKGGSGDVLCGMVTALLAEGYSPLHVARIGVCLHGLAADICLQQQSMESMLATDVIENIGNAFKAVQ